MKLRARAWNVVLVASGGLLAVVLVAGGWLFNHGYRTLEETDAVQQASRAQTALEVEIEELERITRDYAEWIDTVEFLQGQRPSYPEINWTVASLTNVRVDYSLLFLADGLLWRGVEVADDTVRAVQPTAAAAFSREVSRVVSDQTSGTRVHGLKRVDGVLLVFSCTPVFPPELRGHPRGAMINARRVDDDFVARLQRVLGRPVRIDGEEPEGDQPADFAPTSAGDVWLAVRSSDELVTRTSLRDPDGAPLGWLELRLARPFRQQAVWTLWAFVGVIAVSGLLCGGITQRLLHRLVVMRLEGLNRGLTRVRATNDLSTRLPVGGDDEIAQLGHSINGMLEALERGRREREGAQAEREALQDQLARAQRMEVVGEIARGIAHDFNNCLTVIAGWIGLVRESLPESDENRELLSHALTSTEHAVDVVRQLLLYSRQSAPTLETVRLAEMLDGSVKLLRSAVAKSVALELRSSVTDDRVLGDRTQLVQVLVNLVKNAADAMGADGRISILLDPVRLPDAACPGSEGLMAGEYLRLTVRDDGPGIPPDVRLRIFEPFFTTKGSGRGTGLGLAVVSSVVTRHGGAVGVESVPGEGATFSVYLPRQTSADTDGEAPADTGASVSGVRILVAEDDMQVSQVVATIIRRQGGYVVAQPDGAAAWHAFEKEDPPFDLVLTDLNMPRMSGVQLGERVFESSRRVPVVLMSAYAATLDAEKLRRVGFAAVLGKPLVLHSLLATLARARTQVAHRNGDGPRSLL